MWTRQHKQRNTGRLIVPGISALFLAYFGFHAYHGEFGIYSKYQFEARAGELQNKTGCFERPAHGSRTPGSIAS